MATVVNFIDTTLQSAATRTTNTANANVLLDASTNVFHVNGAGANDPASITFTYSLIELDGPATFAITGGTLTTSGNVATLTYANMPGSTASVTASVTVNGVTFTSNPRFITKVLDGASGTGTPGARGAGQYFATGSAWSDATADAATPGSNIAGDVVTISNGTTFVGVKGYNGSAWVPVAPTYDGGAIFPGTVTTNQINANSLILRDAAGNPLVGLGVPLAAGLEAPGTKNSDIGVWLAVQNNDPNFLSTDAWPVITNNSGAAPEFALLTTDTGATSPTCIYARNTVGTADASVWLLDARYYPIDPRRAYEVAGKFYNQAGNGRAAYLALEFYTDTGARIASTTWGGTWGGYAWTGVPAASMFTRYSGMFGATAGNGRTIPQNATQCRIGIILNNGTGGNNLRMAAQEVRLADVTAVLTAQAAADTANTAINDATTGLAQRMRSNAATVLSGGAGIAVGSLTWNSSGVRTGGYGLGLTSAGLVGYNSSAALTFAIDASTGAASFGGTLTAPNMVSTSHIVDDSVSGVDVFSSVNGYGTTTGASFVVATDSKVLILASVANNSGSGSQGYNIEKYNGGSWNIVGNYPTVNTNSSNLFSLTADTYRIVAVAGTGYLTNVTILKIKK
jgi:hypothetical protein